jgi:O-antigen/teichoic acid export membrane protein
VSSADHDALRTDDLVRDLRRRSVRGGLAVLVVQATQFALGLIGTAVLARLLKPSDFGLLAMVSAVSSFLALFLDLGLGLATVQRANLTQRQLSVLFWVNAALGLVVAGVMCGLAPAAARFYDQPEVRTVTVLLSLGFILGGISVQHGALLRRQMRFAVMGTIEVAAGAAGLAVAIWSARRGAGYWSLVYQQLTQQAVATVCLWGASGWRPGRPATAEGVRPLLSFGAGMVGFNLLNYISRTLDNIIIGRVSGAAALGFYVKAYSLLLLPVDRVRGPVAAVVIPALSRLQDDPIRFRSYYLKALTAIAALGMPAVAFLFVVADDMVLLLLGPQWQESVVLFRILAPAAFVETFNTVGSWACLPFGRSGRLVRWQMFATAVTAAAFLTGAGWGAAGVAAGFTLATVGLRAPAVLYLLKGSPVRPSEVFVELARPAAAAAVAGLICHAVRVGQMDGGAVPSRLALAALVFSGSYLMCWMLLPGGRGVLRASLAIVKDVIPRSEARR